ncbi:MAG: helicase-exonuclease AddAB subunit AddA [Phycisphaerae bacterium]|nr:helicase-exonuclease AddAB subunit AddA [Phycisphaerae bacterium]
MSDDRRLTPSQRQAVETIDRSVLVSAAAGTGKTHVLAERCAHLVCDASPACDVDRLLVVTFTEAAAAEMRTRIGQVIRKRLDASPGDERLRRQLPLLDASTITTIHAFCLQLLRRWFARIDLDPDVEVIDADEAEIIRHETLEALFAELYEARGRDELADGFRSLVDAYGMGRDQNIGRMVLALYEFVRSLPNPARWFDRAIERFRFEEEGDQLPEAMDALRGTILLDRIAILGDAVVAEAKTVRSLYPPGADYADLMDDLADQLRDWYRWVKSAEEPDAIEAVVEAIVEYKPARAAARRGLDDDAKRQRQSARDCWTRISNRFKADLQKPAGVLRTPAVLDGLARIAPHVKTLVGLTQAFDRRYQSVKQDEGRVDFSDLERLAKDLLSADEQGENPSDAALQVQAEFDHVLVDEFQDVNPLQEAIIRLVSRETDPGRNDNLFAVGDVKQSIYRFRLAEPEIFLRRMQSFEPGSDDASPGRKRVSGRLVWLQENFRSRAEVLDVVNVLFERIMKRRLSGLDYDEHARFVPGTEYPKDAPGSFGKPAAEIHLIEKNLEDALPTAGEEEESEAPESAAEWEVTEREAFLAGRRIRELTGMAEGHERTVVFEKNPDPTGPTLRPRPIELRDIVVLLRATKGKANHFERVLRNMGIPVYADLTTGYFTSLEVQDVLSLLRIIDNARQDIPLAAVLRAPIVPPKLTESQLVEIRLYARDMPFHAAVRRYAETGEDGDVRNALGDLLGQLRRWRNRLRRQPLSDVLWRILTETSYFAYVGGLHNGQQRRANLIRLHERSRQFNRFARQGLHRFLRFIEDLDKRGRDLGAAPAVSEAEDVVRVMSIHRSKGLEFPVVILPDLGKRFNLEDARRAMLFDRKRFIGLPVVDLEQGVRYPTLSSLAVADEIKRQIRAEEMRILYVAATRARERLILIGTTPLDDLARQRQRGRIEGAVPLIDLVGANTPLDWLIPAVASMPDDLVDWLTSDRPPERCKQLFSVHRHDAVAVSKWSAGIALKPSVSLERFTKLEAVDDGDADSKQVAAVIRRVTEPYAHPAATGMPAVVAASEMKRRFGADHEADEQRPSLRFGSPRPRMPRLACAPDESPAPLTPAERGTLTHLVFEHLDLTRPCDVSDVARQVDDMVARGLMTPRERQALSFETVAWFFGTDLGRRVLAAPDRVRREVPFVLGVSPDRIVTGVECERRDDDVVLVRGMIDCLLCGDAGDEVIDFKTDAITRDELHDRVASYGTQIELYADAVERIWRRPVAGRWLVFLNIPETVMVPTTGS